MNKRDLLAIIAALCMINMAFWLQSQDTQGRVHQLEGMIEDGHSVICLVDSEEGSCMLYEVVERERYGVRRSVRRDYSY